MRQQTVQGNGIVALIAVRKPTTHGFTKRKDWKSSNFRLKPEMINLTSHVESVRGLVQIKRDRILGQEGQFGDTPAVCERRG